MPVDLRCDAFPDDIPDAILDNEIDHRQPVEGDKGITFEPTEMSTHVEFDYLFS